MSTTINSTTIQHKVTWRLIYPFLFLIFLNSLDRVNISFAAIRMNVDLGLDAQSYGFGVGLFFVGYMLFQVPSLWLLQKIGMRRWMTGIVLFWGIIATAMAFIHDEKSFYVLRFLLGVAEAGFSPGITYCCTIWMPKRFRAGAISKTMLAIPISVILGGPLSGWLMDMNNPAGLEGWRWMMFIEGIPTVFLAGFSWWYFVDSPAEARWLNVEERRWLADEIKSEAKPQSERGISVRELLLLPLFWISAFIWFGLLCGSYGLVYWLPLAIKQISDISNVQVGLLNALPWLGIGAGMVVNAWHSDKTQERHWHIALAALLATFGLVAATIAGNGPIALILLVVGGFGIGAAQGTFWTLPTNFLTATASSATITTGIALINMTGNLGGLLGPSVIGAIKQRTGSFDLPVYLIAFILLLAAMAVIAIRPRKPE